MIIMQKLLILFLSLLIAGCSVKKPGKQNISHRKYVIILSLDGFRWDYPDIYSTPVLDSLEKSGVRAELIPVFPSKTFVNHYSLATGLYSDRHGIVFNNFFAPDMNRYYDMKKTAGDGSFYGGEPLWVTAEKQGVKTATLFWVGSEAKIKGFRPSYWYKYNQSLPFEKRIEKVIDWLKLPPAKRPHLIMWYYHEPDGSGHNNGPESNLTKAMVEQLDGWLGDFFTKVKQLPIYDSIDFIILSDHGMTSLSPERKIFLDDYVDTAMLQIINGGNPVFNFKVKEGKLRRVYNDLKNVAHLHVWKHDSLPARLHYGTNPRTLDLTIVSEPGWGLYWSWQKHSYKGTHGYDNQNRDMHAIFYASGADFKKNYRHPAFINVDVYPLVCRLLSLKPAYIDGNIKEVSSMLKK